MEFERRLLVGRADLVLRSTPVDAERRVVVGRVLACQEYGRGDRCDCADDEYAHCGHNRCSAGNSGTQRPPSYVSGFSHERSARVPGSSAIESSSNFDCYAVTEAREID